MEQINKIFFPIFLLAILLCACLGTESEDSDFTTGTVKYIFLEGGFYGITTDDGINLDPLNLPKEFQVDGKRVSLKYKEKKDMASVHMWGIIVEILEIKELK